MKHIRSNPEYYKINKHFAQVFGWRLVEVNPSYCSQSPSFDFENSFTGEKSNWCISPDTPDESLWGYYCPNVMTLENAMRYDPYLVLDIKLHHRMSIHLKQQVFPYRSFEGFHEENDIENIERAIDHIMLEFFQAVYELNPL